MTSLRSKWAAGKAVRAGLAVRGRISKLIRNRRATQPPTHFQRNPQGRGRLAVFPRCLLDPYRFRYGRFATASPARTALKNSQLTCGDATITCGTMHWCIVLHIMVASLRSKWAAGKARGGRISKLIRNRRATQPPAHFQRNPLGRGRLAVFPRCSLGPYAFRYGRFARALKNSQLTCGDVTIICETVH